VWALASTLADVGRLEQIPVEFTHNLRA
jgi:hypothetical protein